MCASCGADPGGEADDDAAVGPPPGVTVSGSFALVSPVDITVNAVLPATVADKIDVLRALRDDPGNAFFDLLEDAGVPLVAELRAVLPDSLEDKVGGWITAAITAPFEQEIDAILDVTDVALARFELVSDLELPAPDARGHARASHALRGARFHVAGEPVEIASPLPLAVAAEATFTHATGGADAALALGPHAFGVAYGELAYELIERVAEERFGMGLREALGELADCPGVASTVAHKCILSLCVGHQAELEALCEQGLDAAVDKLHDELAAVRFDVVSLDAGAATMVDGGDRIVGGVWTARIDLGMGLRSVPATFSGARR